MLPVYLVAGTVSRHLQLLHAAAGRFGGAQVGVPLHATAQDLDLEYHTAACRCTGISDPILTSEIPPTTGGHGCQM